MKRYLKLLTASVAVLSITAVPLFQTGDFARSATAYAQTSVQQQKQTSALTGNDRFQFTRNSTAITVNGVPTSSDEALTVVKGTTYVQFKTIALLYGYQVSYDSKTKQSIAKSGNQSIAFKQGDNAVTVNGKRVSAGGTAFTSNGNLMVPIRAWANATGSTLEVKGGYLSLAFNTLPKANFSINERSIIAGETAVTIKDQATATGNNRIIDEKWEGLKDVYAEPGQYTISRRVMDSRGVWSEPFTVTITVEKPNVPPVANFSTDKSTYKIGEPVYYSNISTDEDGRIIRNTWTGNDPAFFTAGTHTVKLEVQDDKGAVSSVEKQITVTSEVMYTRDQFYLNFAAQGDKIPIDPSFSLRLPSIKYDIVSEDITSVRTNSPEQLLGAAIDYSDTISGAVRFNIHKQNIAEVPLELHLVATNDGDKPTTVTTNRFAFAGPVTHVSTAGKTAAGRFLEALIAPLDPKTVTLQPGESVELMTNVPAITPLKTLTIFGEYYSPSPIRYSLVVTERNGDGIASLDTLSQSEHDGKHIRGTFKGGNRDIVVNKVLGENGGEKIVLGDKPQEHDTLLTGIDAVTGNEITNYGNGGTLYNMTLSIAPNSAVLLNPRGGHYGGAFIVNDVVVPMTSNSILRGQNEAGFLYRSGNFQETINIKYIVAPGSNMPLHLMVVPVPSLEEEKVVVTAPDETTEESALEDGSDIEQVQTQ